MRMLSGWVVDAPADGLLFFMSFRWVDCMAVQMLEEEGVGEGRALRKGRRVWGYLHSGAADSDRIW